ncbi:MAG: hypothetical protein K2M03_05245, partial [Muribaculaceae bacterium]|nr:hypothetical protein [Muribaculaceae bacterium]
AVDFTLTQELKNEVMARELVNRIQNIRKSSDFEITDRIVVRMSDSEPVRSALDTFGEYVASQVLADSIELVETLDASDTAVTELDIDGLKVLAEVKRVK